MFLSLFEFYILAIIFVVLACISPIAQLGSSPYKFHIWNVLVFAACGTLGVVTSSFIWWDAIDHFSLNRYSGDIMMFGAICGLVAGTYLGLRFFGLRTDGYLVEHFS